MKLSKPDEFDLEEPEQERDVDMDVLETPVEHPSDNEEWPLGQVLTFLLVRAEENERAINVLAEQVGIDNPYDHDLYDPTEEFQ